MTYKNNVLLRDCLSSVTHITTINLCRKVIGGFSIINHDLRRMSTLVCGADINSKSNKINDISE